MLRFVLILWLGCTGLFASSPWTKLDHTLQAAYTTTLIADWSQTLGIAEKPGGWEANPILGKHPSRAKINVYFTLSVASGYWLADQLTPPWRRVWQVTVILFQVFIVQRNIELGYKFRF